VCSVYNHGTIGVVVEAPGGFPNFTRRHRRGRPLWPGVSPDSSATNLREETAEFVGAWCPKCNEVREIPRTDLLATAEGKRTRSRVYVI
jgi:hypothetical protein